MTGLHEQITGVIELFTAQTFTCFARFPLSQQQAPGSEMLRTPLTCHPAFRPSQIPNFQLPSDTPPRDPLPGAPVVVLLPQAACLARKDA